MDKEQLYKVIKDLPDEFWQSIRHQSSFKNRDEYDGYLIKQINLWKQK